MATTVVDPIFVDTNVLVYSTVVTAPLYADAFRCLESLRLAGTPLWISRQILREYLATLSRPQSFTGPLTAAVLSADVTRFQRDLQIAEDGPSVTANLLGLLAAVTVGGRQVHDANIVATMQAYGIRNLLTHNTADFARYAA